MDTVKPIWSYPFERLKGSADDGQRLLYLDFGQEDGEMVSIKSSCNSGGSTFRLATHLVTLCQVQAHAPVRTSGHGKAVGHRAVELDGDGE